MTIDTRTIVALFLVPFAANCWSYVITLDEADFLARYENPQGNLNFDQLVDGTSFDEVTGSHPLVRAGYGNGFSIRNSGSGSPTGFSTDWLFRSGSGPGSFWGAVRWVTPGSERYIIEEAGRPRLTIDALSEVSPLAVYTGPNRTGFLGIIPDGPTDSHYFFTAAHTGSTPRIFEIDYGFLEVSESTPISVPASSTLHLLFAAIAGIYLARRRILKSERAGRGAREDSAQNRPTNPCSRQLDPGLPFAAANRPLPQAAPYGRRYAA